MNFLYQRKLMSTCFPGKSGEANPTQKPVVSEKQVSYNVDMVKSFYFRRYL